MPNLRWVEADMRQFELDDQFGLVIIPGHSFQFMLTAEDQLQCLATIRRHLMPGGRLVVHLDHQKLDWLGGLIGGKNNIFELAHELAHPRTGQPVRIFMPGPTSRPRRSRRFARGARHWRRAARSLSDVKACRCGCIVCFALRWSICWHAPG